MLPENREEKEGLPDDRPQKPRYWTRGRILRRLLLLFGLYLGLCAGLAWLNVRPQRLKMPAPPARSDLRFESVSFLSADGTRLAGWYASTPLSPARGVIILCHGVGGNRLTMLGKAILLHDHGYITLLFDFRGRGESGGRLCTLGYHEVDDLLAAVAYVQSLRDTRNLPIGVLGESLGGAVALMGTARNPALRAVVAESPFAQLDHAVYNHFHAALGAGGPILGVPTQWFGERLIGVSCTAVSPLREIPHIAPRPVLLIEDSEDRTAPPSETHALFNAAGQPKTLWTVPYTDHIMAEYTHPDEYAERVTGFFDAALSPARNVTQ